MEVARAAGLREAAKEEGREVGAMEEASEEGEWVVVMEAVPRRKERRRWRRHSLYPV